WPCLGDFQNEAEYRLERGGSTWKRQAQITRNLRREISAEVGLVLARDKKVEKILIAIRLRQKRRLADSAASFQDRHSRRAPGFFANPTQQRNLVFSVKEFHVSQLSLCPITDTAERLFAEPLFTERLFTEGAVSISYWF
ncbi:MAG: hypothetical protein IJI36_06555, partial [Kiritimatiellae bacterium]|nr:hypothetical protein [Kiritimatiellia bacterium]